MRLKHITIKVPAVAAVLLIIGPALAFASPWPEGRPMTMGHRGTTVTEDENTIEAFSAAWKSGLDIFECDPRLTKDGVYVIMHDETVDRTTDGTGKVSDLTLDEIKKLRTEHGRQVPTLVEALEFAHSHGMGVYIDFKVTPKDGGELLVKDIRDTGMTDDVIVGCWDVRTIRMIEGIAPEISTCISWPYPVLTFKQARRLGADAVGTLKGLAGKAAIERAHKQGLKIVTMPIDSAEELDKFASRGLDGLQSDDPRLLQKYSHNLPDKSQ